MVVEPASGAAPAASGGGGAGVGRRPGRPGVGRRHGEKDGEPDGEGAADGGTSVHEVHVLPERMSRPRNGWTRVPQPRRRDLSSSLSAEARGTVTGRQRACRVPVAGRRISSSRGGGPSV